MTFEQGYLFALIALTLASLIWSRVRHDVVAAGALFAAIIGGVVPASAAFSGFGHPATLIIALVLVVGAGLARSGAIELAARHLASTPRPVWAHIGLIGGAGALLSSVMNNVAALALLMPIDLQAAARAKRSAALTLMPLSFATILGGMVTLIGTPPNVVVATFRGDALGEPYRMLDFAPVGGVVALAGGAFVMLVGWRLLPQERGEHDVIAELEDLSRYVIEGVVVPGSASIGARVRDIDDRAEAAAVTLIGVMRGDRRLAADALDEQLREGDSVLLEGSPDDVQQFFGAAGLVVSTSQERRGLLAGPVGLAEVVVPRFAPIEGRTAREVELLRRHGVVLLGISRRGERISEPVRRVKVDAGDILLLLGPEERLIHATRALGGLPLAERGLSVPQGQKAWAAIVLFVAAIGAASMGWLDLPVALIGVVLAYLGLRILPVAALYESVDWPVIVLVGALIPVSGALESTGAAALIADGIVETTSGWSPAVVLTILVVVTMTLSDVLNNVATALIAAPIGLDIAARLGVSPDPFLIGVALASSCAFLTPIGHQNNTIIMGPGGYRFGDYWRLGLPLELIVLAVSIPMILLVWPF